MYHSNEIYIMQLPARSKFIFKGQNVTTGIGVAMGERNLKVGIVVGCENLVALVGFDGYAVDGPLGNGFGRSLDRYFVADLLTGAYDQVVQQVMIEGRFH